jgi:hypothetical protein
VRTRALSKDGVERKIYTISSDYPGSHYSHSWTKITEPDTNQQKGWRFFIDAAWGAQLVGVKQ